MTLRVLAVGNQNTDQVDHRSLVTSLTQSNGNVNHRAGLFPTNNAATLTNVSAMVAGIGPLKAIVENPAGSGQYLVQSDAQENVTFEDGEPVVIRTDRIILRVYNDAQDGSGQNDPVIEYLKGNSSGSPNPLPNGSLLLWDINVPAGASAGSGGINFTSAAVDRRVFTTASGGVVPVANTTELNAITNPYSGMTAYDKALSVLYVHDGANFKAKGQISVSTSSGLSGIVNPYDGLIATTKDKNEIWQHNGSAWVNMGKSIGAILRRSTAYSLAMGGAGYPIPWEASDYLNGVTWSSSSNPSRLIIPSGGAGIWTCKGYFQFATNASGVRDIHILVNGNPVWEDRRSAASGVATSVSGSGDLLLNDGDYVEVRGLQNTSPAVALNVLPARVALFRKGSS